MPKKITDTQQSCDACGAIAHDNFLVSAEHWNLIVPWEYKGGNYVAKVGIRSPFSNEGDNSVMCLSCFDAFAYVRNADYELLPQKGSGVHYLYVGFVRSINFKLQSSRDSIPGKDRLECRLDGQRIKERQKYNTINEMRHQEPKRRSPFEFHDFSELGKAYIQSLPHCPACNVVNMTEYGCSNYSKIVPKKYQRGDQVCFSCLDLFAFAQDMTYDLHKLLKFKGLKKTHVFKVEKSSEVTSDDRINWYSYDPKPGVQRLWKEL